MEQLTDLIVFITSEYLHLDRQNNTAIIYPEYLRLLYPKYLREFYA